MLHQKTQWYVGFCIISSVSTNKVVLYYLVQK